MKEPAQAIHEVAMAQFPTPAFVRLAAGDVESVGAGTILALSAEGDLWAYDGQTPVALWAAGAWISVKAAPHLAS